MQILKVLLELIKLIANSTNGQKRTPSNVTDVAGSQDKKAKPSAPPIKYKNDSSRLVLEHQALLAENRDLYNILEDIREFVFTSFGKGVTITMIGRTQREQDEIYAGKKDKRGREYDKNPWTSPHMYNHAADLRSRDFTKEEIKQIEDYINAKYNPENYYRFTALNHDVGLGGHFHLQFIRREK